MKLKEILQIVLTPLCWSRNDPTDMVWDKELNNLMDNQTPTLGQVNPFDDEIYEIEFNSVEVWVANYPYAYGSKALDTGGHETGLPTRTTAFRLRKLEKALREKKFS